MRHLRIGAVLAVSTLMLSANAARAAVPGSLDTSFSTDGRIVVREPLVGVDVLPSGKSLAIQSDWDVRRYAVDGSIDLSYGGGDGIAAVDFGLLGERTDDAALQADGKLLIVGTITDGGNTQQRIVRLTPSGALDTTFSGDGVRSITPGLSKTADLSVDVARSGRIVVAGTTSDGDAAVVAFTATGRAVTSFGGGDGLARVDFVGGLDIGEGIAIQPDGRIVLVTTTATPDGHENRLGVARLDAAGVLDPSFSGDGRVRVTFASSVELWGGTNGRDVAVHPVTGDVYAGGNVGNAVHEEEASHFAVARFASNGLLERTWTAAPGHSTELRALDLIGTDVLAVGLREQSIAECCGWYVVRFGSVQYSTEEYFDQEVDFAADVEVAGGRAYVVGHIRVIVGGAVRNGGLARFIA